MRKIKFRAWDSDDERMTTMDDFDEYEDNPSNNEKIGQFLNWHFDCELMQYTGLKDKDSVEIYEGDIVDVDNGREFNYFIVSYKDDGFALRRCQKRVKWVMNLATPQRNCHVKVIGNIYENPELIKENKCTTA